MKKFKLSFTGREVSAIGKTYKITATIEAENEKAAILKLYEKYEHIQSLTVNGHKPGEN